MMQVSSSILLALTVLFLERDFTEASTLAEMSRFLTNLTKNGYDKRLRPTTEDNIQTIALRVRVPNNPWQENILKVTQVRIQIGIVAMGPISLLTTTMETEIFLRVYWNDQRLAFDNITELNYNGDPSELVWTPDVYCFNSIKTARQKALTNNVRTKIGPNGDIYVSLRLNIKFSCKMDFRLYPMDTQECSMNFESYSYPYDEVRLSWLQNEPVKFPRKVQLSGYNITSFKAITKNLTYGPNNEVFGFLQAVFTISRLFPFYLYHVYIPSIFLVCLSWSTFWIPRESAPARVSLIVTNFLTSMLIFSQAGQSKPQVPYHTALEVYAAINAIFIMAVMLQYISVLKIPNKAKKKGTSVKEDTVSKHAINNGFQFYEESKEVAYIHRDQFSHRKAEATARRRKVLEADEANLRDAENMSEAHFIDSYARICFPLSYTIFLIFYFTYYMLLA